MCCRPRHTLGGFSSRRVPAFAPEFHRHELRFWPAPLIEFDFRSVTDARPRKLALVQSSRCKPDAHAVIHQDFHPISAAIGKEISTVRLRRTEYRDHFGQCSLGTGAHIHRFGGEPDRVDADHWASSWIKRARPSGSEDGQCTVNFCCPKGISILRL